MTRDQARVGFKEAQTRASHIDIVVYASALIGAGGQLDDAAKRAVRASVDALDASALADVFARASASQHTWIASAVAIRAALVSEHIGDDHAALDWIERAGNITEDVTGGDTASLEQRLTTLKRRAHARSNMRVDHVGLLLPLSGRFARLGVEVEAGIKFAWMSSNSTATLHVLDTGGTPEGARAAVERAVFDHHVVAIVGPVGERESVAAARRATELGVSIALLAPGEGEAAPSSGVFRLWSSPVWEAREAVRLAVELDYDRLAILAPRDEHGQTAIDAFRQAAIALGVEIRAVGTYDPSANELEADVKAFLQLDPKSNRRLRKHLRQHGRKRGWKTFSPDVSFDLLYIPDDYQRAALVASYLPYFNVEVRNREMMDLALLRRKHRGRIPQVVQLMGGAGWHHPGLIPRGGTAVDGALVVDIYAGGELEDYISEEAARFAEAFEAWAGRPPTALTAQAHDAALLVAAAHRRVATATHAGSALGRAMRRALTEASLSSGACGPARIGLRGQIQREGRLLRVDGGMFVLHEY